jgi:hypothetical protein
MPGADNTLDYVSIPSACLVVQGLPLVGWLDSSAVIASTWAAPLLTLAGSLCLPAFLSRLGHGPTTAIEELGECTVRPSLGLLGRCADACASLGLFDVPKLNEREWTTHLSSSLVRLPTPSPFELALGDLDAANAFRTAAVPAVAGRAAVPAVPARRAAGRRPAARRVPAVPAILAVPAVPARSPAALEWWNLAKVKDSYDSTSEFPLAAMWRRGQAAPDRTSVAARDDAGSRVGNLAAILSRHLLFIIGDENATHAARARTLGRVGNRLDALPVALLSHSFDPDVLEVEYADAFAFARSSDRQDAVTAARLLHAERAYPNLVPLLERLPSVAARRDAVDALSAALPAAVASFSLFARLAPVDEFVKTHDAFILQCFNRGIPVPGAGGIISLVLQQHEEWKSAQLPSGQLTSPVDSGELARAPNHGRPAIAYRRALQEDPLFLQALQELEGCDLDSASGREEANEISCLAGCISFQLYHSNPTSMLHRSPAFAILHQCATDMRGYIGKAQAANPLTGEIDELQKHWLPSASSVQLAFAGKLTKFPWFNGDSGALALHNLMVTEPFLPCPEDQIFIVPSVLKLIVPFARATFTAIGWDALSSTGYTMAALFEQQAAHVDFITGLGDLEKGTLLTETAAGFRQALADAEAHIVQLYGDPELVGHKLSHILPFGGAYDVMIKRHLETVKPMITLRRTFPTLMPRSAPRSLPGVQLSTPPSPGGGGAGKGPGKGAGSPAAGHGVPGSMHWVAKWPDDHHAHMGNHIYDVAAICDYYKIDPARFCVSSLSVKQGDNKLALCQQWGQQYHTSSTSAAHIVPTDFNLDYILKHFATPAPGGGGKGKGKGAGRGGGKGGGKGGVNSRGRGAKRSQTEAFDGGA